MDGAGLPRKATGRSSIVDSAASEIQGHHLLPASAPASLPRPGPPSPLRTRTYLAVSHDDDVQVDVEGIGEPYQLSGSLPELRPRRIARKTRTVDQPKSPALRPESDRPDHSDRDIAHASYGSSQVGDVASHVRRGASIEVESWKSLTRLFSNDGKATKPGKNASTAPERPTPMADTPSRELAAETLVEEPASLLTGVHQVPAGEDPLGFVEDKDLLSDDSSDTDDSEPGEVNVANSPASAVVRRLWPWPQGFPTLSPLFRGVAKCVLAYFLASLFTYSPALSAAMAHLLPNHKPDSLVPFSNLHMLATVAVYFHPARTFGSMIEADIFAVVAFAYSMSLSIISMLTAEKLHSLGKPDLSNAISVLFFVGGGMGLVGWAKLKVGKPTFSTACSLVYVSTFTVVVKEGSTHLGRFETDKVWQVSLVVFAGTIVSNIVCFLFWPQRATTNLVNDMARSLDAYATLLKLLTRTFLLEDPSTIHVRSSRLRAATQAHRTAFASLNKNLLEAKYEAIFDARMHGNSALLESLVTSLQRLGQHLGGLRSSCMVQSEILSTSRDNPDRAKADASASDTSLRHYLDAIGPHLRSLVFSCTRTLHTLETTTEDLRSNSGSKQRDPSDAEAASRLFDDLDLDLRTALKRFEHEQKVALRHVYTLEPPLNSLKQSRQDEADSVGVGSTARNNAAQGALASDEAILIVFFFIFNMEELSRELRRLVLIMREIVGMQRQRRSRPWWRFSPSGQQLHGRTSGQSKRGLLGAAIVRPFSLQGPTMEGLPHRGRHALDTAQTPRAVTWRHRWSRWLWSVGQFLRQRDVKFAIKAGFGCALLASPAFIHSTRPTFRQYQGQWALVSFMVVLSPTVGQSNQMSLHRLIGTMFGAIVAVTIYVLFRDNNVILPILGALFSVPCFCYIVGKPQLASSGRFVLLTFNLTCLYAYNLRKTGLEAEQVGFQRTIAVAVGVIWATVLNHLLWPNEARRELAVGLSDMLSEMAWLCQRVVASNLVESAQSSRVVSMGPDVLEAQTLLCDENADDDAPMQQMELYLRFRLLRLEDLLIQTKHEPRLKGPFPVDTYRKYLACCTEILDKLHSIRCMTRRKEWDSTIRKDWIVPVNLHRREMVGNILLFFHILASAMDLKTPLPPYLPPAERSRQALLDSVRALPVVKRRAVRGSSQYLLFYSYCLAMKDVIRQLENLGRLSQDTFGVLGGSVAAFERPFSDECLSHSANSPSAPTST
ncbi:unnamed protein product [Parajaminaea phylloscopi]